MDRTKLYFTIVGIILVMILVVGCSGNKTEMPNIATAASSISVPLPDTDTTPATQPSDEPTDSGETETTTPSTSETATSDSQETTVPGDDTTVPTEEKNYQKGDLTEVGHVYYPDFDIDNPEDLDNFIQAYAPREDIHIVRFVDGEWEGLVSREEDVVQVVKRTEEEQIVTLYYDSGEILVSREKYDETGNIVYSFRDSSGSDHITESYFSDGIETRTVKDRTTGAAKILKVQTVTIGEVTYQRLIYIDTGKDMIQSFEYADFANGILSHMTVSEGGKTYTWNMDGKGNEVANIVSLTVDGNTIPRSTVNLTAYTTPPGQMNHY